MIVLLSPAKSLNEEKSTPDFTTKPTFTSEANALIKVMREVSGDTLKKMMGISDKLVAENLSRYQNYKMRNVEAHGKTAVHLFAGDVYRGLGADDFSKKETKFAQEHLRILSGLYGILKPMDVIQPYRLEMGTSINTIKGSNLYHFWGNKVSKELNKNLNDLKADLIVNLASNEYYKVVDKKALKADVLNVNFKEFRDGKLKFISFSAKVARGLMARYIVKNNVLSADDLKGFNTEGYYFSEEHSKDGEWLFVR